MMDVGGFFFEFEAVRTAFDGRCSAQAHRSIGDEGGLSTGGWQVDYFYVCPACLDSGVYVSYWGRAHFSP